MSFYGAQKIRIRSAEPVETQADGDPTGPATDIRVEVHPLSLLARVAR
jgi:diacylglycerol kinase family enzyme